jgi:CheY-like chemotaxis protein
MNCGASTARSNTSCARQFNGAKAGNLRPTRQHKTSPRPISHHRNNAGGLEGRGKAGSVAAGKRNARSRGMTPKNCRQKVWVLAVDDDEGFLDMLKAALECFDFMVHTASSPKEAITLYRDHRRDISMVLLDYRLPGMTGEKLFENLQSLNPDIRVVLVTSHHESIADKMLARGLRGYLQKPFSLLDLAQRVRDTINAPALACSAPPSPA